jgi:hypothetical protein
MGEELRFRASPTAEIKEHAAKAHLRGFGAIMQRVLPDCRAVMTSPTLQPPPSWSELAEAISLCKTWCESLHLAPREGSCKTA